MKKLFFICLTLLFFSASKAQPNFSHSVGLNYASIYDEFADLTATTGMYVPRLNFPFGDVTSLSLASPISLGFAASSLYGSSIWLDVPLSVEFNFGRLATTDNDEGFGMFAGGGAGWTHVSYGGAGGSFLNWNTYLGARFSIAEKPLELRLNYGKGLGDWSSVGKIGIGLTYTLGME